MGKNHVSCLYVPLDLRHPVERNPKIVERWGPAPLR